MEELDRQLVEMVAGDDAAVLADSAQLEALARRLMQRDRALSTNRQNFLVDASTPHGDAIVTDSAVQKPGIGWVTVHATESIRGGIHEWCVKVESQGETSDGSGLMLGIVPKNYSRFDSFISQGSGWCLSRAGKFYGHWRRVDDNTSVSSLVFGTGDRVVFELDFDASRLTVRVGDRFVVGEISNLTPEVYPAVSLHYRQQHVKFEYHRVHDRHGQRLSWVERGALPSALVTLPLLPHHARRVPLDHHLFALLRKHSGGGCLPSACWHAIVDGEESFAAKLFILKRALAAVQRSVQAGFAQLDDFLPPEVTPAALLSSSTTGEGRDITGGAPLTASMGGPCGALMLVQLLADPVVVAQQPMIAAHALRTATAFLCTSPPLSLGFTAAPHVRTVSAAAQTSLRAFLRPRVAGPLGADDGGIMTAVHGEALELLAALAVQSGRVADIADAAGALLASASANANASGGEEAQEGAATRLLSPRFAALLRLTWGRLAPSPHLDIAALRTTALKHARQLASPQAALLESAMCVVAGTGHLFIHSAVAGIAKIGAGAHGVAVRLHCTTTHPCEFLLGCASCSMAFLAGSDTLLVATDTMAAARVAVVCFAGVDLAVTRTVAFDAVPSWPLSRPFKLVGDGDGRLFVVAQDGDGASPSPGAAPASDPFERRGTLSVFALDEATALGANDSPACLTARLASAPFPPPAETAAQLEPPESTACLMLGRDLQVVFPALPPSRGERHLTVEVWLKLLTRAEHHAVYQHGDRATSGEVFLETCVADGLLCLRGGCRYEVRGARMASVQVPLPAGFACAWHHVALVFDGRWRMYLDGQEAAPARTGAAQPLADAPRGRWVLGGGAVALVRELRVWSLARAPAEVERDLTRPLTGNEMGLLLCCPLTPTDNASGVAFDVSAHKRHGWVIPALAGAGGRRSSGGAPWWTEDATVPVRQLPPRLQAATSAREWLFPTLSDCALCVVDTCLAVSHAADFSAATSSASTHSVTVLISLADSSEAPQPVSAAVHAEDMDRHTTRLAASAADGCAYFVASSGSIGHVRVAGSDATRRLGGVHDARATAAGMAKAAIDGASPTDTALMLLRLVDSQAAHRLRAASVGDIWPLSSPHVPFCVDLSAECIAACVALLRDHFRRIQSVRARRTSSLRSACSAEVVERALRVLRCQLRAALALRLHPVALGLAGADSLAAQLQTVLSGILDDRDADGAPGELPSAAVAEAAAILEEAAPLLHPTAAARAALMMQMLRGQKARKTSHAALLRGLVASFASVQAVIGIAAACPADSAPEDQVLAVARLLLEEARHTFAAALTVADGSVPSDKHVDGLRALGMLQLLLMSRCRSNSTTDASDVPALCSGGQSAGVDAAVAAVASLRGGGQNAMRPTGTGTGSAAGAECVDDVFADVPPPPRAHALVAAEYLHALFTTARFILQTAADVLAGERGAERVRAVCERVRASPVGRLLLPAVGCVPLVASDETATALLRELDALLRGTQRLAAVINAASGAPHQEAVLPVAELREALMCALSWLAAFMCAVGGAEVGQPLPDTVASHPLLRCGVAGDGNAPPAPQLDAAAAAAAGIQGAVAKCAGAATHLLRELRGVHSSDGAAATAALGELERVVKHRLMALKRTPEAYATALGQVAERCGLLLQYSGAQSNREVHLQGMRGVRDRDGATAEGCEVRQRARARWKALGRAWRRWWRLHRVRTLTSALLAPSGVTRLVESFALHDGATCARGELVARAVRDERVASLRREGLSYLLGHVEAARVGETGDGDERALASRATAMYTRIGAQRGSVLAGAAWCSVATGSALRGGVCDLVAHVVSQALGPAPSDVTLSTAVALLDRQWDAEDFEQLVALRAPELLISCISIFPTDPVGGTPGEIRAESSLERAHRLRAHEESTIGGAAAACDDDDSQEKGGVVLTAQERRTARSWSVARELMIECCTAAHRKDPPPDALEAGACARFFTRMAALVAEEVRRCAAFVSPQHHATLERLTAHVEALCSLIAAVMRCFPPPPAPPALSRAALSQLAAALTLALRASVDERYDPAAVSSLGLMRMQQLCLRAFSLIAPRLEPARLDHALIEMRVCSAAPCGAPSGSAAATFLFSLAHPFLAPLNISSATAECALRALRELLAVAPSWRDSVLAVVRSGLAQTKVMVAAEEADLAQREAAIVLISSLRIVDNMPWRPPGPGDEAVVGVRDPLRGSLHNGDTVLVVEVNPVAGTAAVIDSSQAVLEEEREVPLDALVVVDAPLPAAAEVLAPDVADALALLLRNWTITNGSHAGCAASALVLRLATRLVEQFPAAIDVLHLRGVLRELNTVAAPRLALSPLPPPLLAEFAGLILGSHLDQRQWALDIAAVLPRSVLAILDEHCRPSAATTAAGRSARFSPAAARVARRGAAGRDGSCVLPQAAVVLRDRTACIDIAPAQGLERIARLPKGTEGLTAELVVASHAALGGGIGSTTTDWAVPLSPGARCITLLALSSGGRGLESRRVVVALEGDVIAVSVGASRCTAPLYRTARDQGRQAHLAIILDSAARLFRNGELCASVPLDKPAFTDHSPLSHVQCGDGDTADDQGGLACGPKVSRLAVLCGLRIWSCALPQEHLRSIADLILTNEPLPDLVLPGVDALTFRFLEGAGRVTASDGEYFAGTLRGAVCWAPPAFSTVTPETDLRFVDDLVPEPAEPVAVPRREWGAYLGSLDQVARAAVGVHTFMSLSAHYARACVKRAIIDSQRPSHRLLGLTPVSLDSICAPGEIVATVGNLMRYSAGSAPDPDELDSLVAAAVEGISAPHTSEEAHMKNVEAIYGLISAQDEVFRLEMHHHHLLVPESQVHPLLVMHGETFSLSFDSGRGMDYLYVFADRTQKVHIAKYPDPQGLWPELELSRAAWLFLKPSSTSKATAARCVVRGRSLRPAVGVRLLHALVEVAATGLEAALFNQNFLAALAHLAHTATAERRQAALCALTSLFTGWRRSPRAGDSFSRCPLMLLIAPLVELCFVHVHRDIAHGTIAGTPSMSQCRVVQLLMELAVSAMRLEAARLGCELGVAFQCYTSSVRSLYDSAMEQLHWGSLAGAVKLDRPAGASGSVSVRRRAPGTLICSCDRSWQTLLSNVVMTRGRFYFEVRVTHSSSTICVGLASQRFRADDASSSPLGCDSHSWGFDGSRLCRWHGGIRNDFSNRAKWRPRDVIGICVDLEDGMLTAMHNGKLLGVAFENLTCASSPTRHAYHAAVSFNASGCEVNFGGAPFVHEPPQGFLSVEPLGTLSVANSIAACAVFAAAMENLSAGGHLPRSVTGVPAPPFEADSSREGLADVAVGWSDAKPKVDGTTVRAGEQLCIAKGLVAVSSGKWYFEAAIAGDGAAHVGWAAQRMTLDTARTKALGEDEHSWAVDGSRMLARHNKQQRSLGRHPWRDGDVVGCMVDCEAGTIAFSINGQPLRDLHDTHSDGTVFTRVSAKGGLSPAISVDVGCSVGLAFAPEELAFLPAGYAALGAPATAVQVLRQLELGGADAASAAACGDEVPVTYADLRRAVSVLGEVIDFGSAPILSARSMALKAAPYLGTPTAATLALLRHMEVLTCLYARVAPFVPLVVDEGAAAGPLTQAAQTARDVVLPIAALQTLTRCLAMTNGPGEPVKLTLNRRRSVSSAVLPATRQQVDRTIFGQVYSLLAEKPAQLFITSRKLWAVAFAGEGAEDIGGPYRESIAEMCAELMGPRLPLFVPSPNQVANTGEARDRFVAPSRLRPGTELGMYRFLGRVMGGCLRGGELLPLYFPSLLWKRIVGAPLVASDLEQVDSAACRSLDLLLASPEMAAEVIAGGFTTTNTDGEEVELFPGGADVAVTTGAVRAFVSLTRRFKLHEDGRALIDAVVEGFHRVVPRFMVAAMRWEELERAVCGRADFSVAELRANVRYESLLPTDPRVGFLWDVLERFSRHERSLFMRFVSGRERHPLATLRLKLMPSVITDGSDDSHLPHASTCFYWLSLPAYSTAEVLHAKLLYAITNCHDIDADFRVRDEEVEVAPRAVVRSDRDDDADFEDYSHLL